MGLLMGAEREKKNGMHPWMHPWILTRVYGYRSLHVWESIATYSTACCNLKWRCLELLLFFLFS